MERLLLVAMLSFAWPASAQHEDVRHSPSCKYCGMDREKFGHSRMTIRYDDGSTVGTCSLHCAAVDIAVSIDKTPEAIQVADVETKQLVDAEKASWVVGGEKPGVMTRRAKWAFADRPRAEAYAREHGGSVVGFDEAMKGAYEDMYQDTKMIREKRKAKRARVETRGR